VGDAVSAGGSGWGAFLLQPETAAKAIKRRAGIKKAFRNFKRVLLCSRNRVVLKKSSRPAGQSGFVSPRLPSSDSSADQIIVHQAGQFR
jgi:hypothetical protein